MNNKLFTPIVGKFCWIRLITGEYIRAEKLVFGDGWVTVKGADGNIYECDRNIRDGADVMVVLA